MDVADLVHALPPDDHAPPPRPVRIDDLVEPNVSLPAHQRGPAARMVENGGDGAARGPRPCSRPGGRPPETGLEDFGDGGFVERLRLLTATALATEGRVLPRSAA